MCCVTESAGFRNITLGNNSFKIGKRNGRCVLDKVNTSIFFSKYGVIIFLIIFIDSCFFDKNFPDSTRSTSSVALIFVN